MQQIVNSCGRRFRAFQVGGCKFTQRKVDASVPVLNNYLGVCGIHPLKFLKIRISDASSNRDRKRPTLGTDGGM